MRDVFYLDSRKIHDQLILSVEKIIKHNYVHIDVKIEV